MLKEWKDLPENMRTDAVRPYYDMLVRRQAAIVRKRAMDVVFSLVLSLLLSPVMLVIALMIKAEDRGPVFYRQERITTYGRRFRIFKFRTMIVDADKKGPLVTGKADSRITKVGQKLRKCRLDELPQVFNILLGDMSFVGTRPEVAKYVDAYTEEMLATMLLPAGVTSTASIAFKEEDEWIAHYMEKGESADEAYIRHILPRKMRYNLAYLKNAGVLGDFKVMVQTVFAVLR